MGNTRNNSSPRPWQSLQDGNLHSGIVPVTGSLTVELGLGHNNFVPTVSLNGSTAANANLASVVTWAYGAAGTFTIFTWKATSSSVTTLIAATVAVNVSFTVIADSSAGI